MHEDQVRGTTIIAVAILLALAACGPGDAGGGAVETPDAGAPAASTDGSSPGNGGDVIKPQPPGQASASVGGLEFTFTEPGAVACALAPEEFAFSFRIGDNEITIGAGGTRFGDDIGWGGSIIIVVANPEAEPGPIQYAVFLRDIDESTLAFDGSSMSFSGPMLKQAPGGEPPGEDAGTGIVSVTCP